MEKNTYNSIHIGILGFLLLVMVFVPVSYSSPTESGRDTQATFSDSITLTKAYAATPTNPQNPKDTLNTAKGAEANNTSLAGMIGNGIFNTLGMVVLNIASAFTWLGGTLLDFSITYLVLGLGDLINGQKLGVAIDELWAFIRDIANLAFIFGFIFAGIKMVLDPDSHSAKHTISKIIIGALLINFSLFFVKAIIDFSNFTAVQIYNAMIVSSGSISAAFADQLGIITIFNTKNFDFLASVTKITGSSPSTWFYILAALFLIFAGFIFAAAAIMIIIRFCVLVLIMIFSPILFAATVFPKTEHYAGELWGKLISYAFYVPVYLLLTFIVLKLVGSLPLSAGTNWVDALSNTKSETNSFMVILQFGIISFFMIQTLTISSKFSIAGSDMITTKARSLIGASSAGLAARAGRATVGRWSSGKADDEGLKDRASQSGIRGVYARQQLKLFRKGADASFDVRNTDPGKSLKIGSGRKGGWDSVKKEINEKEEKFAKSLGEVGDDDLRVEGRKKEMEDAKTHVRHLQEELKATTDKNARMKLSDDIEEAKHHEHEAKVKYESEKQRRILGSTYEKPEKNMTLEALEFRVKKRKDAIKELWAGKVDKTNPAKTIVKYAALADDAKAARRTEIEKIKKELTDAEKEHGAFLATLIKDTGYAGVRENSKWYSSWPTGRLAVQDQAAGKAMRKARKDGLPKEKGGGHGDSHGGGHDDHGGGHDDHGADDHAVAAHKPAAGGHGGGGGHKPAAGGHGGGGGHKPAAGGHGDH